MNRQIKLNTWDLKSIPYKLEKMKIKSDALFYFCDLVYIRRKLKI